MNLPVLIIAYSRPDGTAAILEKLISFGVKDIYISIDGPKNSRDALNQEEIIRNANSHQSHTISIHIKRHGKNLGAAGGVLTAVDWFFQNEDKGVIIEDDLRFNIDFFNFAEATLFKFKNDSKVWMISGTQHFPNHFVNNQVSWCNYPMIWGWATWANKWEKMRNSLLQRKKIKVRYILNRSYLFWLVGANRALDGKVDAWDTALAFEFMIQKKLCVIPPVNLVSNIGLDSVATNTFDKDESLNTKIENLPTTIIFSDQPNIEDLNKYNLLLEKNIFKIKLRHIFLPYYSFAFDFLRFPKSKRKLTLSKRLAN